MLRRFFEWLLGGDYHAHKWSKWSTEFYSNKQRRECTICRVYEYRWPLIR